MKVAAQPLDADYEHAWRLTARRHEIARWRYEVAAAARGLGANRGAIEVAALGVTELLSNVCKHVGTEARCELVVEQEDKSLCVRLFDPSREAPRVQIPDLLSETGRGLWLLREMAEDIGYILTPEGKWVWVHCALDDRATPQEDPGGSVQERSHSTRSQKWSPSSRS